MIDYNELLKLAEAGDEQAQCMVTNCAAQYANATVAAIEMAELLAQEFEIRIKGSSEAYKQLKPCYFGKRYDPKENVAKLLGKTFSAKVDWSALEAARGYMFLTLDNGGTLLLDDVNFKSVITQKGMAPKMFEAWKLAKGA